MHHPKDGITHTTAFVIPVVEHWLELEIDITERTVPFYSSGIAEIITKAPDTKTSGFLNK